MDRSLVRIVRRAVQRSLIEMSEQNSEILINVLKQTNGDLNDEIFGDQASLIDRIQTKSYKGSWLPGPKSGPDHRLGRSIMDRQSGQLYKRST